VTDEQNPTSPTDDSSLPLLAARGGFGGLLMGLANLVPGISGGTMLLAAGVYTNFIDGIANITLLKFKLRELVLLGAVVAAAMVSILLFAGPIKDLVIHQRWIMFSLFIGLTLGGVPLVWALAQPRDRRLTYGAVAGFALMLGIAVAGGAEQGAGSGYALSVFAGVAGASAMILPGISGSYLLLLMGQYIPILDAVHALKEGLKGRDIAIIMESMHVVIPVGIGVVVGVVGLSNLLKWLLTKHAQLTLGFLLGLLVGSMFGLWPFEAGVEPVIGDVVKGALVTAETLAEIDPEDWPTKAFTPSFLQIAGALGLAGGGFGLTMLISKLGGKKEA
jgi:putative membrane protein